MSLRVQKSWKKLGAPAEPGDHNVRGVGIILGVTEENIQRAAELGGDPVIVLENQDSGSFTPEWVIVEIKGE